jgi:hypothetical protein
MGVISTGVTELDAAEAGDLPSEFLATTVQMYFLPFVSPLTPPSEDVQVAMYPSIAEPPSLLGATTSRLIEPIPTLAAAIVGALGADEPEILLPERISLATASVEEIMKPVSGASEIRSSKGAGHKTRNPPEQIDSRQTRSTVPLLPIQPC